MNTADSGRDERSAVDKAISVMRAFGEGAPLGVGVSELARRTGLSKSTTFRLLATLETNGVVERIGTSYRLGELLDDLSASKDDPLHDLARDTLTPFLAELFVSTQLTVQLAALRGPHVVYLNKLEGHQRLRSPSRIGGRMPAYCTAVGKVLLAGDGLAAEQALRAPRRRWTPNTIVDPDAFAAELDTVRRTGLALDRGETLETLACIAAPVRGANGQVVAALSVSGDASDFPALRHERMLRAVAYSASRALSARQRTHGLAA